MVIIVVIVTVSEAWLQSYGKSCESGIEVGLSSWGQDIPERQNGVCEGMGSPVFSTAAPARCQRDRHRVHFADGEFEVLESCFLPQRKQKGKPFTKQAQHPAFHDSIPGAPSPLGVAFT